MRDQNDVERPLDLPGANLPAEDEAADEGDGFNPFGSGPVPIGPRQVRS